MKYILNLFLSVLLLLSGCANDNTVVKGKLLNAEGEMVVLERLSSAESTPVDSTEVGQNGNFKLSIKEMTEAGFYRLAIDKNNFVILLLDKGEKVQVSGNALDFYSSYEVTGSVGSTELRTLDKTLRGSFEKTDSLRKVFQTHQQAGHPQLDSIAKSIDAVFKTMQEEKRHFVLDFIDSHPNSLASLSAVQALSPEQDLETFEQVASNLSAAMPQSKYVKSFKANLTNIRAKQQSAEKTKIGNAAPEIIVQTPEGNTIKLSDFRGKITMIDFWASWCKPCRVENPHVVKVYNRFKDKGFEIFGVSLDRDKDKWIQAIAQDGLTWKHGSELKFWQSSFVPSYNLDGIPMTYLLDEKGVIIAKGLRGAQLEEKLEEIFN